MRETVKRTARYLLWRGCQLKDVAILSISENEGETERGRERDAGIDEVKGSVLLDCE